MSERVGTVPDLTPLPEASTRLWTRTYLLVCLAGFLAYVNYAFLTPTITLFIADLGGTGATVGLALATYNTISFSLRPVIGRLVDAGRVRAVIGLGCFLLSLGTFLYLVPSLALVFVGRLIQGTGWAGLNMGTYATVARIAPPRRRGEASGYFQMSLTTAGSLLPSVALWLLDLTSYHVVFLLAGLAGLLSAVTTVGMRPAQPKAPAARSERLLASMVEPSALLPSAVLFLMNAAFPAAVFFIPLYARQLEVHNVAIFFLIQGLTSIAAQGGLGRLSDRIGRIPTIALGLLAAIAGLLLLSRAGNLPLLAAGGAFFMFGFGVINPALFAFVMDRARPEKIGAATATYTISFQMGKAVGSFVGGFLIVWTGYRALYVISALPLVACLALLLLLHRAVTAPATGLVER